MSKLIIILLILTSCQKEICGKVVGKPVVNNIHGTSLDVRYGQTVKRIRVSLPVYTSKNVGDPYCE